MKSSDFDYLRRFKVSLSSVLDCGRERCWSARVWRIDFGSSLAWPRGALISSRPLPPRRTKPLSRYPTELAFLQSHSTTELTLPSMSYCPDYVEYFSLSSCSLRSSADDGACASPPLLCLLFFLLTDCSTWLLYAYTVCTRDNVNIPICDESRLLSVPQQLHR